MNARRGLLRFGLLGLLLLAGAMVLALALAPSGLGLEALGSGATEQARRFFLEVRLPRVLLAVAVGGSLAMAGAALQSLLRNPLADPYILGVSGGAAVGGVLAMQLGTALGAAGALGLYPLRALGALGGALLAVLFLVRIVIRSGARDPATLILAGISLNILASAIITVIQATGSPYETQAVLFWLMGSLDEMPPGLLLPAVALGVLAGSAFFLVRAARALNVLSLGEEAAGGAGVDPARLMRTVLGVTAVVAACSATLAGLIGFVGLVVPHAVRLVVGPDNRLVVPLSALAGAILLVLCDTLARQLFVAVGTELPVGALTALLGAPLLVHLLLRQRSHAV